MADTIGRVSVPAPVVSGLAFPFTSEYGYGMVRPWPVIVHRFGERATKSEQRYQVGIGPRKFPFVRRRMSLTDKQTLWSFYESVQGCYQSFTYNAPGPDGTTSPYSVIFEKDLAIDELVNASSFRCNFIECPNPGLTPSYISSSTCLRFPSSTLNDGLLSQVQQIIPLVHVRVRESAVPDIYLSDRRVMVDGITYLPRLIGIGEPGSNVLISQGLTTGPGVLDAGAGGGADQVRLTFGNADRAMTALANDTDLMYASIDLTLLHVNSGILIQLWKGSILGWQSDGSAQFPVTCSDGLYQMTLQYPARQISRTCWKTFNDGVNCPYATQGSGGDPTSCDFYFDSPNGCVSHGMTKFFGGHPAQPQGVNIKDNSTGVFGFGRNTVTATSIVSDTAFGQALPDIWCNQQGNPLFAFIVNAIVVDVRDESDFEDVLGIVGAGPLGGFTIGPGQSGLFVTNADGFTYVVAPMADGFTAHGFKIASNGVSASTNNGLGLRQVVGNDPVNPATDSFSLGQVSGVGMSTFGPQMAAGTAFVELRYAKPSGFTPTPADQHSMTVPISQGLSGWTWSAGGVRSLTPGLINPFWIAVNTMLRGLGLNSADAATQLGTFVLSSLIVGDGSGTAEIANDLVAPIFGTGTELQFQFQGTIAQAKPLRDWLVEILATGLGYFTWEFGKLKLGARINASAVDAYTLGNMVFQSLRLEPINPRFEHLILDFADVAYQYKANTADYQDKSHAAYFGRAGAPLTARQHCVGVSTLSQASRIAATRTREEIGGIDQAEWKTARRATWRTTLLGLNNEPGQVVSVTHPDVPGGVGNFRIERWTLYRDWSIELQGRTVTPSMYDLTVGPKPTDVKPDPLPALFYPQPLGQWAPFDVQADAADALYPGEYTFDLAQSYTVNADGSVAATVTATGKLPVNQFLSGAGAPLIAEGSVAVAATGGSIPGGVTLRAAVCAVDGNGVYSPPSNVILIPIPAGTNTNTITIGDIKWPAVAGLAQAVLFLSTADDLICAQTTINLSSTGGTTYSPTSISFTGVLARSTWGVPNPNIVEVRLKGKDLLHGGVIGAPIDSITGNRTFVCNQAVDVSGLDNWAGRKIQVIGRDNASTPFAGFNCTAFDASTGTFTVDRDLSGVAEGDVIVVCMLGADNSGNPLVVSDPGLVNAANYDLATGISTPHSGLTPGLEVGAVIRVVAGTSRGLWAKTTANDIASYTLDRALPIDATSVWIVEAGTWKFSVGHPIKNAGSQDAVGIVLPTTNYLKQSLLIAAFTVDVNGNESEDGDGPLRPLYLFGAGPEVIVVTEDTTLGQFHQQVNIDTTNGPVTVTLPPSARMLGRRMLFKKISDDTNAATVAAQVINGEQQTIDSGTARVLLNKNDSVEIAGNRA